MQKLFSDTRPMDSAVREKFGLTEEIMMENAAAALEWEMASPDESALILCGGGNNGADGYALARRLTDVTVFQVVPPKSELCILQAERAAKAGVRIIEGEFDGTLADVGVIFDCVFGSGFHGSLDRRTASIMEKVNVSNAHRIACDVPTGLGRDGKCDPSAFMADDTVTMGALKTALFSDGAKDYIGDITCADLGVSRSSFESCGKPAAMLADKEDMELPFRRKKAVHKGSFGHAVIACGEKPGASCIAASAALGFGAGLVTVIRPSEGFSKEMLPKIPASIMSGTRFPDATSAVAFGMGLGRSHEAAEPYFEFLLSHPKVPCIVDADMFYVPELKAFLEGRINSPTVLTPHPKEFRSLLGICGLGDYSVAECADGKLDLAEKFCRAYPGIVLLVKGANPVIGLCCEDGFHAWINPFGTQALAKAGSGDVLAGLICGLLAQYSCDKAGTALRTCSPESGMIGIPEGLPESSSTASGMALRAALNASLAHAIASSRFWNNYSLIPARLIEEIGKL